jgi:hypothetical protein
MDLVNQVILDQAITDEDLDVLYDYYSARSGFGKDQMEYIKNKIERRYPNFLVEHNNFVMKLFQCSVVDGYLVLPRNHSIPMTFTEFLFYLKRTDLKGIRTIPGFERLPGYEPDTYVIGLVPTKENDFCIQRNGNELKYIEMKSNCADYEVTNFRTMEESQDYVETTFETAAEVLGDRSLIKSSFDPSGLVCDFEVKKLYPENFEEVAENLSIDMPLTVFINGLEPNGEYLNRHSYNLKFFKFFGTTVALHETMRFTHDDPGIWYIEDEGITDLFDCETFFSLDVDGKVKFLKDELFFLGYEEEKVR